MSDKVRIHNTTAKVHGLGGVIGPDAVSLLPGYNTVTRAFWEQAKLQEMVKIHIKEGHFVELTESEPAPAPSAPRPSVSTITTASILDAAKPTPPSGDTKTASSETIPAVGETKKHAGDTIEKKHEKHGSRK